jgi:D-alanyl-lipoteichoic acid acyltransferase DltB (MBOAT superfamily)
MLLLRNSISGVDFFFLIPVLICMVASALPSLLPMLRFRYGLLTIGLLATAGIYRQAMLGYLLVNFVTYLFLTGVARLPKTQRWRWSKAAILVLIILFLAGRYYHLETRAVSPLGVKLFYFSLDMWAFLRLITLLWEFGSARIQRPGEFSFVMWIVLPFTLTGPLLRYSQFEVQLASLFGPKRPENVISSAWWRGIGLATLQISLGLLLAGFQLSLPESGLPRWEKVAITFLLAPWSFYLLWAGYFRFMEEFAVFWGLKLPPSFNKPFGRANLSEYWAAWNMTATSVFRDYLFYNRWGRKSFNIYVNTLIVFTLVGLWHSMNWYWVLWGAIHGVGFCAYVWYKKNKERFRLTPPQFFHGQRRVLGAVATYLYVCAALMLPSQLIKLFKLI